MKQRIFLEKVRDYINLVLAEKDESELYRQGKANRLQRIKTEKNNVLNKMLVLIKELLK